MAISITQSKGVDDVSFTSATLSLTLAAGVSAGAILMVAAFENVAGGGTTMVISDGSGDTFTDGALGVRTDSFGNKSHWGAFLKPTAGVTTVTMTSNGVIGGALYAWEFAPGKSGTWFLDKNVAADGTGTAAASGSSGTLTEANEAAIALLVAGGGTNLIDPPWVNNDRTADTLFRGANQVVSSNAAISATATIGSGQWLLGLLTAYHVSSPPPFQRRRKLYTPKRWF